MSTFTHYVPDFPTVKQFKDKTDVHLAWEWKLKSADKVVWTQTGARTIENRYQNFMVKVFDALTLLGYRYVIDIGKGGLFVKTGEPIIHSSHLLVDTAYHEGKVVVELQVRSSGVGVNSVGRYRWRIIARVYN